MTHRNETDVNHQPIEAEVDSLGRRKFLQTSSLAAVAGAATFAWPHRSYAAAADLDAITAEITKRHDESVKRLQTWIRQPSIAAENRGMSEGCELTMNMLREAGFGQVSKVSTDGQPGIFATLDAGAPRTVGLYFMYDVKQADPAEWSRGSKSERPGSYVPGCFARDSWRRQKTPGEFRICRRRRRRNRVTTFLTNC